VHGESNQYAETLLSLTLRSIKSYVLEGGLSFDIHGHKQMKLRDLGSRANYTD
jgi:hypothetical protein